MVRRWPFTEPCAAGPRNISGRLCKDISCLPASSEWLVIGSPDYGFPAVTHYYLLSLPATILAVFLGRAINHRLHGDGFLKYIYLSLVGIGAVLSIQAIAGRR